MVGMNVGLYKITCTCCIRNSTNFQNKIVYTNILHERDNANLNCDEGRPRFCANVNFKAWRR